MPAAIMFPKFHPRFRGGGDSTLLILLLSFLLLGATARAQLDELPSCSVDCERKAAESIDCDFNDTDCVCADTIFIPSILNCAVHACGTDDQVRVGNILGRTCGGLTSSSTTLTGSSTSSSAPSTSLTTSGSSSVVTVTATPSSPANPSPTTATTTTNRGTTQPPSPSSNPTLTAPSSSSSASFSSALASTGPSGTVTTFSTFSPLATTDRVLPSATGNNGGTSLSPSSASFAALVACVVAYAALY